MECHRLLSNSNEIRFGKTDQKKSTGVNKALSFHFVFEGTENFLVKRRKLSVFPDSFLTLNSGTSYTNEVDSHQPVQSLSIYLDKNFVKDFVSSWNDIDALNLESDSAEDIILNETIYPFTGDMKYNIGHLNNLVNAQSADELLLNEHLHHCLINYCSLYRKEIFERAEKLEFVQSKTRKEIYRRLSLTKEFLYSNYNQDITVQQLAEHSYMSINHLLRMFKQAFNMSPHQFLMRIRLQRARIYLERTDYPVNEIVNLIGLNCASSFIESFKKRYQITPLKYRYKTNFKSN